MSVFVYVSQDVIPATAADNLLRSPPCNTLRRAIPKDDFSLGICDINTVSKNVQQFGGVNALKDGNRIDC
jgi:hypothetical protein